MRGCNRAAAVVFLALAARTESAVKIPAAALALLPTAGGRHARVSAFVAILDGGDVTTAAPVRREFRRGDDEFADAEGRYVFTGEAVVAPGSTISIGILDEVTTAQRPARPSS